MLPRNPLGKFFERQNIADEQRLVGMGEDFGFQVIERVRNP